MYVCPHYPNDVKAEIEQLSEATQRSLADQVWCAEQARKKLPQIGAHVFRFLARFVAN